MYMYINVCMSGVSGGVKEEKNGKCSYLGVH